MSLHPDVMEAIDQIDAAIFSGDGGGLSGVNLLKEKCERWLRGLKDLEECFERECPECAGIGEAGYGTDDPQTCQKCGGEGFLDAKEEPSASDADFMLKCPECGATDDVADLEESAPGDGYVCNNCQHEPMEWL